MTSRYDPINNGYDPAIYGGPISEILVIDQKLSSELEEHDDSRIFGGTISRDIVIDKNLGVLLSNLDE